MSVLKIIGYSIAAFGAVGFVWCHIQMWRQRRALKQVNKMLADLPCQRCGGTGMLASETRVSGFMPCPDC